MQLKKCGKPQETKNQKSTLFGRSFGFRPENVFFPWVFSFFGLDPQTRGDIWRNFWKEELLKKLERIVSRYQAKGEGFKRRDVAQTKNYFEKKEFDYKGTKRCLIQKSHKKGFQKERRIKSYESCFQRGRMGSTKEESHWKQKVWFQKKELIREKMGFIKKEDLFQKTKCLQGSDQKGRIWLKRRSLIENRDTVWRCLKEKRFATSGNLDWKGRLVFARMIRFTRTGVWRKSFIKREDLYLRRRVRLKRNRVGLEKEGLN